MVFIWMVSIVCYCVFDLICYYNVRNEVELNDDVLLGMEII